MPFTLYISLALTRYQRPWVARLWRCVCMSIYRTKCLCLSMSRGNRPDNWAGWPHFSSGGSHSMVLRWGVCRFSVDIPAPQPPTNIFLNLMGLRRAYSWLFSVNTFRLKGWVAIFKQKTPNWRSLQKQVVQLPKVLGKRLDLTVAVIGGHKLRSIHFHKHKIFNSNFLDQVTFRVRFGRFCFHMFGGAAQVCFDTLHKLEARGYFWFLARNDPAPRRRVWKKQSAPCEISARSCPVVWPFASGHAGAATCVWFECSTS